MFGIGVWKQAESLLTRLVIITTHPVTSQGILWTIIPPHITKNSWLIWGFSLSHHCDRHSLKSLPCGSCLKMGDFGVTTTGNLDVPSDKHLVVTPHHLYCCCWIWTHCNYNVVSHFLCFMTADTPELPAFPTETWWSTEGWGFFNQGSTDIQNWLYMKEGKILGAVDERVQLLE